SGASPQASRRKDHSRFSNGREPRPTGVHVVEFIVSKVGSKVVYRLRQETGEKVITSPRHPSASGSKRRRSSLPELLRNIPILAGLDDPALRLLWDHTLENKVPASSVIVREGDEGNRFFLIAKGSVKV